MDSFMAEHFCQGKEKKSEMVLWLLSTDKITYENKRKTLQCILEKHCQDFIAIYPTYLKELSEIGEIRNILAHGWLDTHNFVEHSETETLVMKIYKKEAKFIVLDKDAIDELKNLIIFNTNKLLHWKTLDWVH